MQKRQLPAASKYEYVHPTNTADVFIRKEDRIDLRTITNKRIEKLLAKDAEYWPRHFQRHFQLKKPKQKKKKDTPPKIEEAEE